MALNLNKYFGNFKNSFKKKKLAYILSTLAVALVIFLSVFAVGIYKYKWEDNFTLGVSRVFPYPVAFVNNQFISYKDYLENLNINKKISD